MKTLENPSGSRAYSEPAKGAVQAHSGTDDAARTARRSFPMITGAIAILLVLSWQGECWAYIDPNAGGFLAQTLAPLTAIVLSFFFYCRKEIRRFAKSIRDRWKGAVSPSAADEVKK
ncbi:MAG: hypothetical protein ACREQI_15535 [Candidatus Binataceae bacterium]